MSDSDEDDTTQPMQPTQPMPKLRLVRSEDAQEDAQEDAPDASRASMVIGNAVMHAAMSWVACCMEQPGISVQVASLGGGLFDAEVTLADGRSIFVRVTLALESGPRLRTLVEPVHP